MGLLLALMTAIFFGISNIFARRGLEEHDFNSFLGVLLTLKFVNLVNIPIFIIYIFSCPTSGFRWMAMIFFIIAGFLNTFLGRKLLFSSIEYIGPSRAGTLKFISPIIVVIIGVTILNEQLSVGAWIGILTILLGIFLVSQETRAKGKKLTISRMILEKGNYNKKGVLYGLFAGAAFGMGNVFRKAGINIYPSFITAVFVSSLFALFCIFIYVSIIGQKQEAKLLLKNYWSGPYVWTGIFTSLALYCLFGALQFAQVSIVNSIAASEPLFTMLASVMFLGQTEKLNKNLIFRSIIIILGLVILFIYS